MIASGAIGISIFWIGRFHMQPISWLVCTDGKAHGQDVHFLLALALIHCCGFWCLGIGLKRRGISQWNVVWKAALTSHWELLFLIIMEIGHCFTCHHREYRDRQDVMYQPCPILAVIAFSLHAILQFLWQIQGRVGGGGRGVDWTPLLMLASVWTPLETRIIWFVHLLYTPPSQKLLLPLRESLIHARVLCCTCLGVWGGSENCVLFDSQSVSTTLSCTDICSSCPEVP